MALTVPSAQIAHIKKFLELPEGEVEGFLQALSEAGSQFNVEDLSAEVSGRLEQPRDLTDGIVRVLASLYLTKNAADVPIEPFVDKVVFVALKKAGTFAEESADTQWAKFRRFLLAALSLENTLGTAAKAGHVLTQHERIFHNAQILTDVRPIFHQDVSERPGAALIVHMLRMTQRNNHGNYTDQFFALDSNDIRKIKALIERALKKEETLKNLMKDSKVSVVDPKETF
jgi:hypothetical protein